MIPSNDLLKNNLTKLWILSKMTIMQANFPVISKYRHRLILDKIERYNETQDIFTGLMNFSHDIIMRGISYLRRKNTKKQKNV